MKASFEEGAEIRRARDRFLQVHNLRLFLLLYIDVHIYYTHEQDSYSSSPDRTNPSDPTHGARLPLHYPPGTSRPLLQPQLLGRRQELLPLPAPRQGSAGPTTHRELPPIPATHRAIRSADHRADPSPVEYRR